jgi:hypothetical protein
MREWVGYKSQHFHSHLHLLYFASQSLKSQPVLQWEFIHEHRTSKWSRVELDSRMGLALLVATKWNSYCCLIVENKGD